MKKFLSVLKRIVNVLIVLVAVAMMVFTIVSVTTFDRNDRSVFGYKAFIVRSDSMKATDFAAGDIVIVKNVDPESLTEGDIIAYSSTASENYGEIITHKIRRKAVNPEGGAGFVTYGTTNDTDDETIVTYPYINGKYVFRLPKVGVFFTYLKTTPGYILFILIPFLLLIGLQGIDTVKLFRRYRKEQTEAIEKERAELAAERKRSDEMMAELMKLKATLDKQNAESSSGSDQQKNE